MKYKIINNRAKKSLFHAMAVIGLSAVASQAQVVIDYDTPDADSYVQWGSATNYGTQGSMWVQYNSTTTNRRMSYVRFDLFADDAESTLENGSVSAAQVTFRYGGAGTNKPANTILVYGLNADFQGGDGLLGQDWGETVINGNNAPWGSAPHPNGSPNATLLGSFSLPAQADGTPLGTEFSITGTDLINFINTSLSSGQPHSNLVTFMLFEQTLASQPSYWITKENTSYAPSSLSITVVPEPTTGGLAVGGIGILALLSRNRLRRLVENP